MNPTYLRDIVSMGRQHEKLAALGYETTVCNSKTGSLTPPFQDCELLPKSQTLQKQSRRERENRTIKVQRRLSKCIPAVVAEICLSILGTEVPES